jgi:hypothetical protein
MSAELSLELLLVFPKLNEQKLDTPQQNFLKKKKNKKNIGFL